MAKRLNQDIIQAAVSFTREWPRYLPPDIAAEYRQLADMTGKDADKKRLLKFPVWRGQAAAAFASGENSAYPDEMTEAAVQIATAMIIRERDQLRAQMEKDGVTEEDLTERDAGPISAWICNRANDGPRTFSELLYSEDFSDRALYLHIVLTEAAHCIQAIQNGGTGAAAIDELSAKIVDLISRKWEIVAEPDVMVAPLLPRPSYPTQKFLAVDQCTRAIIDPLSKENEVLYTDADNKLTVYPKKGVPTTIWIRTAVDAALQSLSLEARGMYETCTNLLNDADMNGYEAVWPMDHVVRNYKCGGSAAGISDVKVTAAEREAAWEWMEELKRTELRVDWQKEAGKLDVDDYAPFVGALVSWDREPRLICGMVKDCLVINSIPLYRYACAVGRIDRRDAQLSMIDYGKRWRRNDRNVALHNYMYRQVVEASRTRAVTFKDLRLDNIWDHCRDMNAAGSKEWGDLTRDAKMYFRKEITQVTGAFKASGLIKQDAEFLKNTKGEMDRVRVYPRKKRKTQTGSPRTLKPGKS